MKEPIRLIRWLGHVSYKLAALNGEPYKYGIASYAGTNQNFKKHLDQGPTEADWLVAKDQSDE